MFQEAHLFSRMHCSHKKQTKNKPETTSSSKKDAKAGATSTGYNSKAAPP
jgi:hypothetical protein